MKRPYFNKFRQSTGRDAKQRDSKGIGTRGSLFLRHRTTWRERGTSEAEGSAPLAHPGTQAPPTSYVVFTCPRMWSLPSWSKCEPQQQHHFHRKGKSQNLHTSLLPTSTSENLILWSHQGWKIYFPSGVYVLC